MTFRSIRSFAVLAAVAAWLCAGFSPIFAQESSSSNGQQDTDQVTQRVKSPSLVDPAGPTVSLIPSETVFIMAAALNACGYDDGLDQSDPVRLKVRQEMNDTLAKSEAARAARDKVCLYIAQHRMTGTVMDVAQYISLALYLTPPPDLETTAQPSEMPPDSVAVADIVPLLKDFVNALDLHGVWLALRPLYEGEIVTLHDPLSKMVVQTDLYLKMPASTYSGSRFVVVVEPQLSPNTVNARIYGSDYVVVVSPANGHIRMNDVRHTYLHYVIEPLLYARANAIDRTLPILKEVHDAPLPYRYRSDPIPLTVECFIKAIEARTMDTGIPNYVFPPGIDRSQMPRYEHQQELVTQQQEAVRRALVAHDERQGYVLTDYFYNQLLVFEKQPASLRDTIGEIVYSIDVLDEAHKAHEMEFDKTADEEVMMRPQPRVLTGLDLAEARLAAGDLATAAAMARKTLAHSDGTPQGVANSARADFILARAALMTGKPDDAIDDFQKTVASSKDARLVSWSHIYLGRMLDLDCKRDQAVAEYKLALDTRDGQLDTRLAAERGVKTAFAVNGHSCQDDSDDDAPAPAPPASGPVAAGGQSATTSGQGATRKPQ